MGHELLRIQRHALLLAMSSTQRVAHFLLEMCSRLEQGDVLTLPMTRQDIADHLGLTIETVSRAVSQFKTRGLIETRHLGEVVVLRDRDALRRVCEGERVY